MPTPEFFSDTDPKALAILIELQRRMTLAQKAALVFELSDMLLELSAQGVRQQYPEAEERELFLRMASRHLDRETMIRAYGWDPDDHDAAGHQGRS